MNLYLENLLNTLKMMYTQISSEPNCVSLLLMEGIEMVEGLFEIHVE